MRIRAQVAHAVPGRVRLRLPEQRGNGELFARLEQDLLASDLFEDVHSNPATASMVLEFAGVLEDMLPELAERFGLDVTPLAPPQRVPTQQTAAADDQPFDPLRLVTGRDINPMYVVGTVFGAIGVVQALRGTVMVPALTAFWYSLNAFRAASESHALPGPVASLAGAVEAVEAAGEGANGD